MANIKHQLPFVKLKKHEIFNIERN